MVNLKGVNYVLAWIHSARRGVKMSRGPQEVISDLQCPICVAENDAVGGGFGYADRFFNYERELWAVCVVHQVRWYVTRELSLVDRNDRLAHPDPDAASKLPLVEGIFRIKH